MPSSVRILADSISPAGHRLTTVEMTLPRIILAELNTHRMLSRNSASSRAIPVPKKIDAVNEDPFVPSSFGKNRKGMQATENLDEDAQEAAQSFWLGARGSATFWAAELNRIEVHKQLANRLLEPFSWHTVILTATDWDNAFALRCHDNAQPEIREPFEMLREAMRENEPRPINYGDWHLPLVFGNEDVGSDGFDLEVQGMTAMDLARVSAARCARVSYLTHEGKRDVAADLGLCQRLMESGHMSPLEHPARPMTPDELGMFKQWKHEWDGERFVSPTPEQTHYLGNFNGWVQLRKLVPGEAVFRG